MAWICVELDGVLVEKAPGQPDPTTGEAAPQDMPTDGAIEAMTILAEEGHRLTVFTSRFNVMPASIKQKMKEELEQQLAAMEFPPIEVWTGTTKPSADVFIDNNAVTYDGDWGLALAQTQQMLEDRGLEPGPQPGAAEAAQLYGQDEEPNEQG